MLLNSAYPIPYCPNDLELSRKFLDIVLLGGRFDNTQYTSACDTSQVIMISILTNRWLGKRIYLKC